MKAIRSLTFILILAIGCKKDAPEIVVPIVDPPVVEDSIPTTKFNLSLLSFCNLFSQNAVVKTMANQNYVELSGIAASAVNSDILYVHDDGSTKNVYLTNSNGDDLGKLILDNVSLSDWEDIAVGPGPVNGKSYIYVADIGDNNIKASSVTVYRFEEPIITNANANTQIHITGVDKIKLSYARGSANAETLMVDPLTKDLYILTKGVGKSYVYKAVYPQSLTATTKMDAIALLNLDLLTGGDISADGNEILLRNTGQIWYWKRTNGETILQTLIKAPQDAPYKANEKQGEGICFSANGDGYFTNTETKGHSGAISALTFYPRVK